MRALEGAGAGFVVASLLVASGVESPALLGLLVVIVTLARTVLGDSWRWGWWRSLPDVASRVERRTPTGRNLLYTAAELAGKERGYVPDIVMHRASGIAAQLDPRRLFPLRRALGWFGLGVAAFALSQLRPTALERALPGSPTTGISQIAVRRVDVTITPPAYTGLARTTLSNPSRIDALANSRIEVRVIASASSVRLETLSGSGDLSRSGEVFHGSVNAQADGFLAIEPRDSTGTAAARVLIGLTVTPDRPPRVTLTSPGRDLFFSTVPASVPVAITAEDDLALGSVELRYTAVSGSGERFTFVERTVPVTLTRTTVNAWSARGTWSLAQLELAPGDLVVYRAIATDRRPSAPPVESESYVIEVVTPGAIAAEGFAADDQRDRYAASQQMVILKTERLLARRASLPPDSLSQESRMLSAEQRQVRAEFVFMMGGEVEDLAAEAAGTLELNEVAEAEAEGDLLAGRLQNQGRVDMMRAIRAMSRASAALTDANLDQALRDERVALDNLMRAFARSRFILRALTQRERIDLDRRLSGSLNRTSGLSGPVAEGAPPGEVAGLRRLLAELAALSSGDSAAVRGARAVDATVALLRTAPGSDTLRALAARVQDVARDLQAGPEVRRARVDSLVRQVVTLVAVALPLARDDVESPVTGALDGALRDALARRSPRP